MAIKKTSATQSAKSASVASRAALPTKNKLSSRPVSASAESAAKTKAESKTSNVPKEPQKLSAAKAIEEMNQHLSKKAAESAKEKAAEAGEVMRAKSKGKAGSKGAGKTNGLDLPGAATEVLPKTDSGLEKDLAKKPAGSLKSPLRIFQVYYESWQRDLLDPNFSGLDNSKSASETKEFAVYEQLLASDYVKDAELWGALSWRFAEMTGMSGGDLIKSIQSHPGNDVYFCNPYPQNEALFHNGWQQGETAHPQFLAMAKVIFEVTGLPVEELTSISSSELFSSTHFMVATPKFWQAYLPWVKNVLSLANKKLPPKVRDLMHSKLADERNLHNGATYVPFIVERLFPVFMKTQGKTLKAYKIPLPERERELNVHLKLLREMKDVAYRTKSAWLGVCWANYRNLYFAQVNGKEWCDKYLRAITPTEIKFS